MVVREPVDFVADVKVRHFLIKRDVVLARFARATQFDISYRLEVPFNTKPVNRVFACIGFFII